MQKAEIAHASKAQEKSFAALTKQLEIMSVSAQLTALDTMYRYHVERLERFESSPATITRDSFGYETRTTNPRIKETQTKIDKVVRRIDTLVTDLEKRTGENPGQQ